MGTVKSQFSSLINSLRASDAVNKCGLLLFTIFFFFIFLLFFFFHDSSPTCQVGSE